MKKTRALLACLPAGMVAVAALLSTSAHADMPWEIRDDAWCLPASESALPLLNAVSAQDLVLQIKSKLDAAYVVAPARSMSDAQWDTFIGNVAWAKAQSETFALVLAKQPAQTLKQYTDACGRGGDPLLQAKLDQALADLAAAKAALGRANTELTATKSALGRANSDLAAAKAQVANLTAERDAEKARADSAEAQVTQLTAERDALKAELEQVAAWRAWLPKLRELLGSAPAE